MPARAEDSTVLLQRYIQSHELYMSYLNRFFDVQHGRSPARVGDTLTSDALVELERLYAEERVAHQRWMEHIVETRPRP